MNKITKEETFKGKVSKVSYEKKYVVMVFIPPQKSFLAVRIKSLTEPIMVIVNTQRVNMSRMLTELILAGKTPTTRA